MTDAGSESRAADWTAPERDVLATAREYLDAGESAVLATVVGVEGRAYRRPGAKMVVAPDAGGAGSVTAGCLADDLRRLATDVLDDGPRVETFDLGGDGAWGLGVGCDGVVDVLLEPLGERHRPLLAAGTGSDEARPDEGARAGDGAASDDAAPDDATPTDGSGATTALTAIESDDDRVAVGDRAYRSGENGDAADALPREVLAVAPADVTDARTVETDVGGGRIRLFVERVTPPPRLVVVGSGADVRPVVDLARSAGFRVTVVGFRGGRATAERFPRADRVVATSPRDLTADVSVDGETSVVVMTHNFVDDRLALGAVYSTPARYVGVMGPESRFERLREALAEDGNALDGDDLARTYAPVGLNLGGETPVQVAQSVVAEVLAVQNGRDGGHLSAVDGPIHDRE